MNTGRIVKKGCIMFLVIIVLVLSLVISGCGNAYIIGDKVFTRGCLRASIEETGKMDCLILCDGAGGIVWD
ncbi:MAG: hypothetical protein MST07_08880 [Firmicutes bacterium]|nr:hypothetical protein [Bacillota bacterium]